MARLPSIAQFQEQMNLNLDEFVPKLFYREGPKLLIPCRDISAFVLRQNDRVLPP